MDAEVESGKFWVQAQLRKLYEKKTLPIFTFEWEEPRKRKAGHFFGMLHLAVWLEGERKLLLFREVELADVEGDPELQEVLCRRIRGSLESRERGSISIWR